MDTISRVFFLLLLVVGSLGIHDLDPFVGVSHADRHGKVIQSAGHVAVHVPQGKIRIKLRPDLSQPSVDYVVKVAQEKKCGADCTFYRAEQNFLLQGVIRTPVPANRQLGDCPQEFKDKPRSTPCPSHDPNCGCHGPIMYPG
eukprot:CAMPEP_0197862820 /NCGR_PEP_ID=MMETSP1438-20131217/39844_1 /TAXON_ID=1461541 /ORGANISM="Pterosperma sp., Strain CCMP1384" /LENGTH=141 /DNA_ID=CAMNT_0043480493 /DNA_START=143 /DNA_END=564 /DNA_ORIENTATION=+